MARRQAFACSNTRGGVIHTYTAKQAHALCAQVGRMKRGVMGKKKRK